jgi:hypothetical protein
VDRGLLSVYLVLEVSSVKERMISHLKDVELIDLDTLIVIDLTCLHGLRCVSERAPCVRAMCGAGQHAGEVVHAQGRRSDHMCPRGDVHLLYIRCMTLNEIARLGKKSRLKVVRKK